MPPLKQVDSCNRENCRLTLFTPAPPSHSEPTDKVMALSIPGVIRAAGCWLWLPSLALRSSFRPSLWLSLCPGSHTWNVYVDAVGRRRGWCSPVHKKRIHEVQTTNENGCRPRGLVASIRPSFWNAWLWFGVSPECPHFGYFSPRGWAKFLYRCAWWGLGWLESSSPCSWRGSTYWCWTLQFGPWIRKGCSQTWSHSVPRGFSSWSGRKDF